eukprot:90146-Chlamydomonas_euryale.AAC.1
MLRVQPTAAQQGTCLALDNAYIPLCAAISRVCIGGRLLVLYVLVVQETHDSLVNSFALSEWKMRDATL